MKATLTARLATAALATFFIAAAGQAQAFELQWYGQSAFRIETPGGKRIVIDPFLTGNPKTPAEYKDLDAVGPVDLILVTHGHADHVGDTAELARRTGAKVAMNADMGQTFATLGLVPADQLIRFNKSGSIHPLGPDITITMVHAEHSSELVYTDPQSGGRSVHPGGEPAGYIVRLENGFTLYHAGDTGVFGDMAYIGRYYRPDLALLPIGGHFTMDPAHAAYAIRELLGVRRVIPMHYGTFPPLKGTPAELESALGDAPVEVLTMRPGETREF